MATREEYPTLPSTQSRAIELARGGAVEGTAVVAGTQTAGRGRLDHRWYSPPGGLYLSIVLAPRQEVDPLLSVSVGAELAERFEQRFGTTLAVRWPNDVVYRRPDGRAAKVAGILVDNVVTPAGAIRSVVGFGVNVNSDPRGFPADIRDTSTSLAQICELRPSIPEVETEAVRVAMDLTRTVGEAGPGRRGLETARRHLYGVGREGSVDGRRAGRIRGIAADGSLEIEGVSGLVHVRSGEVLIEGP